MARRRKPPVGVAIRATIVILIGAILTLLFTVAVVGAILAYQLDIITAPGAVLIAILLLALSILILAAGIGLYNLRPWAWWLAVIALLVQLMAAILGTGLISPAGVDAGLTVIAWLTIVIPGLSIIYMMGVRKHFR